MNPSDLLTSWYRSSRCLRRLSRLSIRVRSESSVPSTHLRGGGHLVNSHFSYWLWHGSHSFGMGSNPSLACCSVTLPLAIDGFLPRLLQALAQLRAMHLHHVSTGAG